MLPLEVLMAIERHLHRVHHTRSPGRVPANPAAQRLNPAQASHQQIMFMQRTVGNQAVTRLLAQRRLDARTGQIMREEAPAEDEQVAEEVPITPLHDVQIVPPPDTPDETDHGRVVHLRGLTTAHWSQSTHAAQTSNLQFGRTTGCTDCAEDDPCIRVSATVTCTYNVPVSVSLPDLDSMGLNECEREQAQHWVDTVLSPHEQEHVQKFSTYNGTTTHNVRFVSCNSAAQDTLAERVETIVSAEHASRQSSAQSQSDALDPFNFDFELNCPEPEEETAEDSESEESS
jgi:hypothetical protein